MSRLSCRRYWIGLDSYRRRARTCECGTEIRQSRLATQMLNDGAPIAVVAGRLAHARGLTTLNVYAHAVSGGDRAAGKTLARRLLGGSTGDD